MTLPNGLVKAAADGHLVPFVGAGVSLSVTAPGGGRLFPSWWGLLTQLGDELAAEGRSQAALVKAFMAQQPADLLQAAKYAREGFGAAWYQALARVFDPPDFDPASLALPKAIWRLSNLVITTNYDRVLQWASPKPHTTRTVGINSPQLAGFLRAVDRPTVWHLHGHVQEPEEIILTPDGYTTLYPAPGAEAAHEAALQTLRATVAARTLLFVGFSLEDAAFVKQLEWVRDTFQGAGGPHYVLVREADAGAMAVKLQGLDVRTVTFSDFGAPLVAAVEAIAAAAGGGAPTPAPSPEPAPAPVHEPAGPAVAPPSLVEIVSKASVNGLAAPGQRALLLSGFPVGYVGQMPLVGAPTGQLQTDLNHLITRRSASIQGPPLALWLENAAGILAMADHEDAAVFRAWAAAVRAA